MNSKIDSNKNMLKTASHSTPVVDKQDGWKSHWDLLLALIILSVELVLEYGFKYELTKIIAIVVNSIAYLLAGRQVLNLAFRKSLRGDFSMSLCL